VARDTLSARLNPRQTLAALTAAIGGTTPEGPDAGTVIHANGVPGLQATGLGRGVKGQAMLLAHAAPDAPQIYADGLYIVPHADGTTAIGSTSETTWADPTATDAQLDSLRQRAEAILPALATAPEITRWAALRPRADTRQPILGPWPGRPGHILANGAFKLGFGLAPAVARLIADLAITGQADIPEPFLPPSSLPKYSGGS
jgi:glycine/D-amino acid oxidase-like deaminating enzyme